MWNDFTFLDFLGVIGSLMICGAYLAVSLKRVDPEGFPFHIVNAAGSVLLLISLYFRPNPGAIVIEVLWLAIASFAICRALLKRR
ncbi:MAG TPA: hypothetical protein VMY41_19860 [Thermohalobaculum sp.]|nr:hypothetical protein [Thermohalobaculum sp.]